MSEWTVDTLKEHFDALREDDQEAIAAALAAAKEAVIKAEVASEKRFEGINEFRGALNDVVSRNVTRNEWSSSHEALIEKITELQRRADKNEGRGSGLSSAGAIAVGAIGVIGTIAFIIDIIIKLKP
jgi:hypothetical protein